MTKHARGQNISDQLVKDVVEILDGWATKLTWDLLIEKVKQRLKVTYTRQALHQHERISLAFATRKKALARRGTSASKTIGDSEQDKSLERLERLKAENERLEVENDRLLEQFARWAYNASTRNLSIDFLNRPLPAVDRDQTKLTKTGKKS